MRPLSIVWQRLVSPDGATCNRCAGTQRQVERAVVTLTNALGPLGIEPCVEIGELDDSVFSRDPSASNRIWISGRPLEDWLAGTVESSRCSSVCGDAECRTVEVGGTTYETIPERLIVRAGLLAAAALLENPEPDGEPSLCCGSSETMAASLQ
jgi:hypothetical protein